MTKLTITVFWDPEEQATPVDFILEALARDNLTTVVQELRDNEASLPIVGDTLYDQRGDEMGKLSIELDEG